MRGTLKGLAMAITMATLAACSTQGGDPLAPNGDNAGVSLAKGNNQDSQLQASLTGRGIANAKGKAVYKSRPDRRELQIQVENVVALNGTSVGFYVGGGLVGSATVALGAAAIDLSTQLGQAVPSVSAGTSVEVRTSSGMVVAAGSF